jgi:hypothetical protein
MTPTDIAAAVSDDNNGDTDPDHGLTIRHSN